MFPIAISIHAPRVGSDRSFGVRPSSYSFQSTLPAWGATNRHFLGFELEKISIHAPRVGSDAFAAAGYTGKVISIHAPRVGSDSGTRSSLMWETVFQSTLPAWGATSRDGR